MREKENLNPIEGLDEPVLPVNIAAINTDANGVVTDVQMAEQTGPAITRAQTTATDGRGI